MLWQTFCRHPGAGFQMNRTFSGMLASIERFHLRLGVVAGLLTIGLIIAIVPDIVARNVFNVAIYGMSELSVVALVAMVFLGLPAAQAQKENYRVLIVDNLVGEKAIRYLSMFRGAACVIIAVAFAYYSIVGAIDSVMRNEATFSVVRFPVWPSRIIIAIGFTLLAIQFVIDFVRILTVGSDKSPVSAKLKGLD